MKKMNNWVMSLCAILIFFANTAQASALEEATAAYKNQDYAAALKNFKKSAMQGNPEA